MQSVMKSLNSYFNKIWSVKVTEIAFRQLIKLLTVCLPQIQHIKRQPYIVTAYR